MAELTNTETFSNQASNAAYDMATELFDANQLDPMYGPSVYSGYALVNNITDPEDLVKASDNGDVDNDYFGYYEDTAELMDDLADAQRDIDDVVICNGFVYVR